MKIAIITTSGRDLLKSWERTEPALGTAVVALLQGFSHFSEHEIHVLMPVRRNIQPVRQVGNTFYHEVSTPMWGMMKSLYFGSTLAVRNKLREIRPDIVHGQGTERECALAAVFSGFPNVLTIHGNMLAMRKVLKAKTGSFYWFAEKLETFAMGRTGGVFCNSAYTEELVRPRSRKIWRVPNAIAEFFFSKISIQPNLNCPLLVNVGHVGMHKRQVEILDMAAALHAEGFRFEIQFFGNCNGQDSYGREFLKRIEQAGIAGYARHTGFKPSAQIVAALDAAQGIIHFPSEEAFGLAPAEGLARNLKLFGSKIGGIIDIATGAEGAELIDVDDWNGLRVAIGSWLKNGAPVPTAASIQMRARYHPDVIARRHVEIYREVLEKN